MKKAIFSTDITGKTYFHGFQERKMTNAEAVETIKSFRDEYAMGLEDKHIEAFDVAINELEKRIETVNGVLQNIQSMCSQIDCDNCPYHKTNAFNACSIANIPCHWDLDDLEV